MSEKETLPPLKEVASKNNTNLPPYLLSKYRGQNQALSLPPAYSTITSLLDIPHLLTAIRGFLPVSSILCCCLVSHSFHEWFIPGLWHTLAIGFSAKEKARRYDCWWPSNSLRAAFALYGRHVRHLSFVASPSRTSFFFRGLGTGSDRGEEEVNTESNSDGLSTPGENSAIESCTTLSSSGLPSLPPLRSLSSHPPLPTNSHVKWKWSAKLALSSIFSLTPTSAQPQAVAVHSRSPSTTMVHSPLPIAVLSRRDPRREGATAELCPNLISLAIEISDKLGTGWCVQETELALLFLARNQRLRSLTINNFPVRSQTMMALLFRVLKELSGLQELRLEIGCGQWMGNDVVSGGLFQSLLLNLPRTSRICDGPQRECSLLKLLEVQWSIDDNKYQKGYWSHGEWHQHDPNHPNRVHSHSLANDVPSTERGPKDPAIVLWPVYNSLSTIRFWGKMQGFEDRLLIPFLANACPNLMELHCPNVLHEKQDAIHAAINVRICCFEEEKRCAAIGSKQMETEEVNSWQQR